MKQRKPRNKAPRDMVDAQKSALSKVGAKNTSVESGSVPNPHDG